MNYYYDYYYYLTAVKQVNLATNEYFGHDENGTILAIAISHESGTQKSLTILPSRLNPSSSSSFSCLMFCCGCVLKRGRNINRAIVGSGG